MCFSWNNASIITVVCYYVYYICCLLLQDVNELGLVLHFVVDYMFSVTNMNEPNATKSDNGRTKLGLLSQCQDFDNSESVMNNDQVGGAKCDDLIKLDPYQNNVRTQINRNTNDDETDIVQLSSDSYMESDDKQLQSSTTVSTKNCGVIDEEVKAIRRLTDFDNTVTHGIAQTTMNELSRVTTQVQIGSGIETTVEMKSYHVFSPILNGVHIVKQQTVTQDRGLCRVFYLKEIGLLLERCHVEKRQLMMTYVSWVKTITLHTKLDKQITVHKIGETNKSNVVRKEPLASTALKCSTSGPPSRTVSMLQPLNIDGTVNSRGYSTTETVITKVEIKDRSAENEHIVVNCNCSQHETRKNQVVRYVEDKEGFLSHSSSQWNYIINDVDECTLICRTEVTLGYNRTTTRLTDGHTFYQQSVENPIGVVTMDLVDLYTHRCERSCITYETNANTTDNHLFDINTVVPILSDKRVYEDITTRKNLLSTDDIKQIEVHHDRQLTMLAETGICRATFVNSYGTKTNHNELGHVTTRDQIVSGTETTEKMKNYVFSTNWTGVHFIKQLIMTEDRGLYRVFYLEEITLLLEQCRVEIRQLMMHCVSCTKTMTLHTKEVKQIKVNKIDETNQSYVARIGPFSSTALKRLTSAPPSETVSMLKPLNIAGTVNSRGCNYTGNVITKVEIKDRSAENERMVAYGPSTVHIVSRNCVESNNCMLRNLVDSHCFYMKHNCAMFPAHVPYVDESDEMKLSLGNDEMFSKTNTATYPTDSFPKATININLRCLQLLDHNQFVKRNCSQHNTPMEQVIRYVEDKRGYLSHSSSQWKHIVNDGDECTLICRSEETLRYNSTTTRLTDNHMFYQQSVKNKNSVVTMEIEELCTYIYVESCQTYETNANTTTNHLFDINAVVSMISDNRICVNITTRRNMLSADYVTSKRINVDHDRQLTTLAEIGICRAVFVNDNGGQINCSYVERPGTQISRSTYPSSVQSKMALHTVMTENLRANETDEAKCTNFGGAMFRTTALQKFLSVTMFRTEHWLYRIPSALYSEPSYDRDIATPRMCSTSMKQSETVLMLHQHNSTPTLTSTEYSISKHTTGIIVNKDKLDCVGYRHSISSASNAISVISNNGHKICVELDGDVFRNPRDAHGFEVNQKLGLYYVHIPHGDGSDRMTLDFGNKEMSSQTEAPANKDVVMLLQHTIFTNQRWSRAQLMDQNNANAVPIAFNSAECTQQTTSISKHIRSFGGKDCYMLSTCSQWKNTAEDDGVCVFSYRMEEAFRYDRLPIKLNVHHPVNHDTVQSHERHQLNKESGVSRLNNTTGLLTDLCLAMYRNDNWFKRKTNAMNSELSYDKYIATALMCSTSRKRRETASILHRFNMGTPTLTDTKYPSSELTTVSDAYKAKFKIHGVDYGHSISFVPHVIGITSISNDNHMVYVQLNGDLFPNPRGAHGLEVNQKVEVPPVHTPHVNESDRVTLDLGNKDMASEIKIPANNDVVKYLEHKMLTKQMCSRAQSMGQNNDNAAPIVFDSAECSQLVTAMREDIRNFGDNVYYVLSTSSQWKPMIVDLDVCISNCRIEEAFHEYSKVYQTDEKYQTNSMTGVPRLYNTTVLQKHLCLAMYRTEQWLYIMTDALQSEPSCDRDIPTALICSTSIKQSATASMLHQYNMSTPHFAVTEFSSSKKTTGIVVNEAIFIVRSVDHEQSVSTDSIYIDGRICIEFNGDLIRNHTDAWNNDANQKDVMHSVRTLHADESGLKILSSVYKEISSQIYTPATNQDELQVPQNTTNTVQMCSQEKLLDQNNDNAIPTAMFMPEDIATARICLTSMAQSGRVSILHLSNMNTPTMTDTEYPKSKHTTGTVVKEAIVMLRRVDYRYIVFFASNCIPNICNDVQMGYIEVLSKLRTGTVLEPRASYCDVNHAIKLSFEQTSSKTNTTPDLMEVNFHYQHALNPEQRYSRAKQPLVRNQYKAFPSEFTSAKWSRMKVMLSLDIRIDIQGFVSDIIIRKCYSSIKHWTTSMFDMFNMRQTETYMLQSMCIQTSGNNNGKVQIMNRTDDLGQTAIALKLTQTICTHSQTDCDESNDVMLSQQRGANRFEVIQNDVTHTVIVPYVEVIDQMKLRTGNEDQPNKSNSTTSPTKDSFNHQHITDTEQSASLPDIHNHANTILSTVVSVNYSQKTVSVIHNHRNVHYQEIVTLHTCSQWQRAIKCNGDGPYICRMMETFVYDNMTTEGIDGQTMTRYIVDMLQSYTIIGTIEQYSDAIHTVHDSARLVVTDANKTQTFKNIHFEIDTVILIRPVNETTFVVNIENALIKTKMQLSCYDDITFNRSEMADTRIHLKSNQSTGNVVNKCEVVRNISVDYDIRVASAVNVICNHSQTCYDDSDCSKLPKLPNAQYFETNISSVLHVIHAPHIVGSFTLKFVLVLGNREQFSQTYKRGPRSQLFDRNNVNDVSIEFTRQKRSIGVDIGIIVGNKESHMSNTSIQWKSLFEEDGMYISNCKSEKWKYQNDVTTGKHCTVDHLQVLSDISVEIFNKPTNPVDVRCYLDNFIRAPNVEVQNNVMDLRLTFDHYIFVNRCGIQNDISVKQKTNQNHINVHCLANVNNNQAQTINGSGVNANITKELLWSKEGQSQNEQTNTSWKDVKKIEEMISISDCSKTCRCKKICNCKLISTPKWLFEVQPELNNITYVYPVRQGFTQMNVEWNRFISFNGYLGNGNAFCLARNGFYHDAVNGSTSTICHFCHARRDNWQSSDADRIEAEHRRNCQLYRCTSNNIPIIRDNNQIRVPINERLGVHNGAGASNSSNTHRSAGSPPSLHGRFGNQGGDCRNALPPPNLYRRGAVRMPDRPFRRRPIRGPIVDLREQIVDLNGLARDNQPVARRYGPIVDLRRHIIDLGGANTRREVRRQHPDLRRRAGAASNLTAICERRRQPVANNATLTARANCRVVTGETSRGDRTDEVLLHLDDSVCIHCRIRPAVVQPCGHTVCCKECERGRRTCPQCFRG